MISRANYKLTLIVLLAFFASLSDVSSQQQPILQPLSNAVRPRS